jgi:hypothetical protein
VSITKRDKIWEVLTDAPWSCRIFYNPSHISILEFALVSFERGEEVVKLDKVYLRICAEYGVEPNAQHITENGNVRYEWGCEQRFSTHSLEIALFEPVIARLSQATSAVFERLPLNG